MNDLDDWLAGPTDPGLGKPAGTAADMCHEYLLPIGSPRMALDDSTQTPMLRWQGCVKDDVFFAQAPADPFFLEDDIASLSSHASSITELLQRSVEGTPSDLLYDHEPLFDGIEEDLNQDQAHVVRTEPIRRNSTVSTDLDWSALLDELCDDDDENLKRKRPEEEDDVVEERICHLHLSDSTSSSEEEELIKTNRRIKRRKKSGLPCKKHTKKKSAPSPVIIEQAQDGLTLFENLTQAGIDWCRYCGTTEGVNWRPGPWGKRTLCK
ncbi:hypothetical protein DFQ28_006831 [Apophysomyces sp. BC1034]|nr:hypothetical protein DFQ30_005983 [Apophysomyces sp. BC1015]KAG0177412.1 hypothetical protein DFQ29_004880 [Apophysomyces sp. BC1021]KAG0187132.1 hypothetical protein DFQ28_006831 [Apophysomyces sp. BC1034]